MLSGRIEYTVPPTLWYTFDGRPLRGVEDYRSGKNTTAFIKNSRHIDVCYGGVTIWYKSNTIVQRVYIS